MKRIIVIIFLFLILGINANAQQEPLRIAVSTNLPNTFGAVTVDVLNSSGGALSPVVSYTSSLQTDTYGILSFVIKSNEWSNPLTYNKDYLVRVTFQGVVLSIERMEVVFAKQGLFGARIDANEIDPEGDYTFRSITTSQIASVPATFLKKVTITSSSSSAFTVPAGVYNITIEAIGGSGGGGGSGADFNSSGGATGGGGGGGAAEFTGIILKVQPGDFIGVTIDAAGTAGAGGPLSGTGDGSNGGTGGSTIVKHNSNIVLTANGGTGGGGSVGNKNSSLGSAKGSGGSGGTGNSPQFHSDGNSGADGTDSASGTTIGNGGEGGKGTTPTDVSVKNKGGTGGNGVYGNSSTTKAGVAGTAGSAGSVVITYY